MSDKKKVFGMTMEQMSKIREDFVEINAEELAVKLPLVTTHEELDELKKHVYPDNDGAFKMIVIRRDELYLEDAKKAQTKEEYKMIFESAPRGGAARLYTFDKLIGLSNDLEDLSELIPYVEGDSPKRISIYNKIIDLMEKCKEQAELEQIKKYGATRLEILIMEDRCDRAEALEQAATETDLKTGEGEIKPDPPDPKDGIINDIILKL